MASVQRLAGAEGFPARKWLAQDEGKRWTELFFLFYSPVWITWALGIVVPFGFYHKFGEWEYMWVGLGAAVPCFVLPLLLQSKADAARPWHQRFWVKANVWIAIFSFVGNYFWTHYFFALLGASYTFPSFRLNQIPIPLYMLTHAYFCFYHTVSNLTIRRVSHWASGAFPGSSILAAGARMSAVALWVGALAYATAYMETLTISHFDYYTFVDKGAMYRVGSLFYAIYFFVSFPLFFRIEEDAGEPKWGLPRVAIDSLGSAMLVTILLDLWRISVGAIVDLPISQASCPSSPGGITSGTAASLASGKQLVWM